MTEDTNNHDHEAEVLDVAAGVGAFWNPHSVQQDVPQTVPPIVSTPRTGSLGFNPTAAVSDSVVGQVV